MEELEKKLWKKTNRYMKFLQIVPFVKMVAVCNNLAFSKADEKSDIDLFVVAKTGRLFFVRSFITLLLSLLGVRRHGDKIAGRFCLSFFVDEHGMNLETIAIEKDIYLAFWLKSMLPVIAEEGFSADFLKANLWASSYFERENDFVISESKILNSSAFCSAFRVIFDFVFSGEFGDFVEKKLGMWQMKRAGVKAKAVSDRGNLLISEHVLKFHNIDRRREYRGLWNAKYGEKKLTSERFLALEPDS